MLMGVRSGISELWPPTGLLFVSQAILEHVEPWWNNIGRVIPKNSEENLSQCHFVHHKSHID
jgi:hypothetical protein